MEKLFTPALVGAILLIATAIGMAPPAMADHEGGHTEIEAGPVLINLTRLEPRIPVTVNEAPVVYAPVQMLGQIAAITVSIEAFQGADNTTFTTAGFGFRN